MSEKEKPKTEDPSDATFDAFDPRTTHLVPRNMKAPPLPVPRGPALVNPGLLIGDSDLTIVGCIRCRTKLYTVRLLGATKASVSTEVKSLGPWKVPKPDDSECPACHFGYRNYNPDTGAFIYSTSKGLM